MSEDSGLLAEMLSQVSAELCVRLSLEGGAEQCLSKCVVSMKRAGLKLVLSSCNRS